MTTARDIIRALGADAIMRDLGVGKAALKKAGIENKFSTSWFDGLEALAKERDVELPRELFPWRRAAE